VHLLLSRDYFDLVEIADVHWMYSLVEVVEVDGWMEYLEAV